jgi:hypothetical protein
MEMDILTQQGLVSFLQQGENTKKIQTNKNADYCYNFQYM